MCYKMQLETLKKIREKSLIHGEQVENSEDAHGEQENTVDILVAKSNGSRATVQRFIRLTELIIRRIF